MARKTQLLVGGAAILAILAAVAWQGFQSTVFYYTPAELLADPDSYTGRVIRMGALVQPESTEFDPQAVQLRFRVTEDSEHFIPVVFDGVKPDMFREGQGVVVEGRLGGDGVFRASQVLVKHSEEYSVGDAKRRDKERIYKSLMQARQ
jgi:cytochrome c-type biogenesis protein CcmE